MLRFFRKKPAPDKPAKDQNPVDKPAADSAVAPDALDSLPAPEPVQPPLPTPAEPSVISPASGTAAPAQPEPIDTADTTTTAAASPTARPAKPAAGKPDTAPIPAPAIPAPAESTRSGWRSRLAGSSLGVGLRALFSGNPALDEDLLDELETALITADVGITASTELIGQLRTQMRARAYADSTALLADLRQRLRALLDPVARPLAIDPAASPFAILVVGVNGVGKTTSIGKLARRLHGEGRSVVLAAGDTFRAAAVAQLQTWGQRLDIPVYSQGQGADSASVIFDALQAARSRKQNVLIADTAGRLHTQAGLMDELAKIRRVMAKLDPDTPHEVLQVIDATTGQNAVSQVRQFREAAGVTGLVVTKLDGSAKGGVVFALAREFNLPIRYIGLGEGADDLQVFDPDAFVDGLLPERLEG